jgi:hypothetical protein
MLYESSIGSPKSALNLLLHGSVPVSDVSGEDVPFQGVGGNVQIYARRAEDLPPARCESRPAALKRQRIEHPLVLLTAQERDFVRVDPKSPAQVGPYTWAFEMHHEGCPAQAAPTAAECENKDAFLREVGESLWHSAAIAVYIQTIHRS